MLTGKYEGLKRDSILEDFFHFQAVSWSDAAAVPVIFPDIAAEDVVDTCHIIL